jgi:hypothetical protein
MDHECKQHPWFVKINAKTFSNDIEKKIHCRLNQLQNNFDERILCIGMRLLLLQVLPIWFTLWYHD